MGHTFAQELAARYKQVKTSPNSQQLEKVKNQLRTAVESGDTKITVNQNEVNDWCKEELEKEGLTIKPMGIWYYIGFDPNK